MILKNGNMRTVVSVAAMLALVLMVSCSDVNYSGVVENVDGEMNSASFVRFDMDWSQIREEHPEDVIVLMNRIQNVTVHYAWKVDDEGNPISSIKEPLQEGEQTRKMIVQNGLYTLMGVSAYNQDDYLIPDLDSYEDSLTYKTKDIYAVVPEVPDADRFQQNLVDLNPMCPFIRSIEPMYFLRSDNNALITKVNESPEDGMVTVPVTMQKLTHNFKFEVLLKTEDRSRADGDMTEVEDGVVGVVYLDALKAAISGIPYKAQLMSGYVSKEKTGKVGFQLDKKSETRVNDGTSELNLYEGTYEGSINAFGLFSSENSDHLAGSGILNIFLYPKIYYETPEGEKVSVTRVFHASINIKDEIDAAKIMVQVPDKDLYVYAKDGDTELKVRTSIVLSYEDVLTGTSQGLKEWTSNELNPDDNFNPGLEM